jgi:nucleotidyltransferase substrate binding protein (TIGR01987 family)
MWYFMTYYELRWQQRFQNFSRSFLLLEQSTELENPSVIERAGMVQFFEISFEQSWKVLKDFLEEEGFDVKSPRDAIKTAFQYGFIENATVWLEALKDRNLTRHTYNEETAIKVENNIKLRYYPLLKSLYIDFNKKLAEK